MYKTFSCCLVILYGGFNDIFLLILTQPEEGEEEVVDLFTTPSTKIAAAISDFGYNVFRQLASQDPPGNVFLSPVSVSQALTQLSMGKDNMYLKSQCLLICLRGVFADSKLQSHF